MEIVSPPADETIVSAFERDERLEIRPPYGARYTRAFADDVIDTPLALGGPPASSYRCAREPHVN